MTVDPRKQKPIERVDLVAPSASGAAFKTESGPIRVQHYAPGIVRVRFGERNAPDYGLVSAGPLTRKSRVAETDTGWSVTAGDLSVILEPSPLRLSFTRRGAELLGSSTDGHIRGVLRLPPIARAGSGWSLALALDSGEGIYGLGEKFGRLDRRGQLIDSWNEDALGVNAEISYKNTPFAWSTRGWGLFVNTPARVVHGVGFPQWSHRSYVLQTPEPELDLFLFAADTPAALIERYTWLTGRAPVPPRWSFGVWMSRCYYRTEAEALQVARKLRERKIPCDVLVLDGRAWLKVDTRFGFEWDRERYPDPARFVAELRKLGLRLNVWEYPLIATRSSAFHELAQKGYLLKDRGGRPYIYRWDPEPFGEVLTPLPDSGLLDFTNPDAYAWWRDRHKGLFETGVDSIKTDFGEQVPSDAVAHNGDGGARLHNVYPMLFNACVYEATKRYAKGGAVVWGRSGWAGSQRYPIQWGGDPQADWEGLAASIRGGLSWGMSGAPYYAHDIGGFSGPKPGAELYVRWTQAGVMCSHTRFHGTTPREPWEFGDQAEKIVKEWLALRYRLIPYLEACGLEAGKNGMPILRAMPLAFPQFPECRSSEEQYLLGPALLVVPVLRPKGVAPHYLPPGDWYDIWTGKRVTGPTLINEAVPLDRLPVYGVDGTILPLGPAAQSTAELKGRTPPIEEVWFFGVPRAGLVLPGREVRVRVKDERAVVSGLPAGVTVKTFGRAKARRVKTDWIVTAR